MVYRHLNIDWGERMPRLPITTISHSQQPNYHCASADVCKDSGIRLKQNGPIGGEWILGVILLPSSGCQPQYCSKAADRSLGHRITEFCPHQWVTRKKGSFRCDRELVDGIWHLPTAQSRWWSVAVSDLAHVYYNEMTFQPIDAEKLEVSITRFEEKRKPVAKVEVWKIRSPN